MRPISHTVSIDAPRERVFDFLTDISARPAITDHFLTELRLGRIEPVGVGASARFQIAESGRWMDSTIEVAERPHLIRERGSGGRSNKVPAITVWELAEGPGPGSCEVTLTFWTEPSTPLQKLAELAPSTRRLRRGWKRALARLRDVVEGGEPVARVQVAGGDRLPAFSR